jgi:hypothetical protein
MRLCLLHVCYVKELLLFLHNRKGLLRRFGGGSEGENGTKNGEGST